MTLYDYDLVVMGDSPAARASVELAARYRARVAWLQDITSTPDSSLPGSVISADLAWFGFHALRTMVQGQPLNGSTFSLNVTEVLASVRRQAQAHQLRRSSAGFADLGVDLLDPLSSSGTQHAAGQNWTFELRKRRFVLARQLSAFASSASVSTSQRVLLSRGYLFAPQPQPHIPELPGLEQIAWDTLHSWMDWSYLPQTITIVGREPRGIALAQLWARLGCEVTLVTRQAHLLKEGSGPSVPARLMESLLQAEGVRLVTDVDRLTVAPTALSVDEVQKRSKTDPVCADSVRHLHETPSKICVTADHQRWEVERLVLATGWQPDASGVQWSIPGAEPSLNEPDAVRTTPWGRTQHRQVYAVGAALGRDGYGAVDRQLAGMATRHILFGCRPRVAMSSEPRVTWTLPPLVCLGLTMEQAQTKYGADVQICSGTIPDNLRLHLSDSVLGSVQLIVHRKRGCLLGAVLMGQAATEWCGAIALALQQKLSVTALAQMPCLEPTVAALIQSAAEQWRWQRLAERPRVEDLWERFFNWRRTGGI